MVKDQLPTHRRRALQFNHPEFVRAEEDKNRAKAELKAQSLRDKEEKAVAKVASKALAMKTKAEKEAKRAQRKQESMEKARQKTLGVYPDPKALDELEQLREKTKKLSPKEQEARKNADDNQACSVCTVWWSDYRKIKGLLWNVCDKCNKAFCSGCWWKANACCELLDG